MKPARKLTASHAKTAQFAASPAILVAILLATAAIAWMPRAARAQAGEDVNKMFDDADEYGNFGAPPAPPGSPGAPPAPNLPPPDPNAGTPQGVYTPPDTNSGAGFPADSGNRGRTPSKPSAGGKKGAPPAASKGKNGLSIANAGPEDITNENFPDLIDSFDYPNAEITDIVKAISQLTKRNFIIDSGVRGKISIVAPTQITVAEAYKAFLSALAANGFTVVPSGKFFKIKQARDAQRDSIETYSGAYYPNSDLMITRILHLKHISAEEVNKQLLRILPSKNGEMTPYPPTNSLIISDYGANIERITRILDQLDRAGFDEQLQVVPIRYAKVKDVAELITKIINKDPGGAQASGGFGAVRPFRPTTGGKAEELSIVAPDERTNSLIVVGNSAGIEKVRTLVKKLDYKLDPAEAGGVNVYYVKYGEATKIAKTINGLSSTTGAATPAGGQAGGFGQPLGGFGSPGRVVSPLDRQNIFNGDVKIVDDPATNSLVITASKQDYETVLNLLSKLDIQRDQVYIEAIIMELNVGRTRVWDLAVYHFNDDGTGTGTGTTAGRIGFSGGNNTLGKALDPTQDAGAILGFGTGGPLKLTVPGSAGVVTVPSLLAFINFLQQNTDTNILATPQLLATDNEEAEVEVGSEAPVGQSTATTGNTTTASTQREKLTTKLKVKAFIRPDSDAVRMNIELPIKQFNNDQVITATALAQTSIVTSDRNIKTMITVHDGDTAVLGGLISDKETLTETKVPILGDIPVLGWLFKTSRTQKQKTNLMVFITPKIIRSVADSQRNFVRKAKQRIDWVKENAQGRDPYGKTMDEMPRTSKVDESAGPTSGSIKTNGRKNEKVEPEFKTE